MTESYEKRHKSGHKRFTKGTTCSAPLHVTLSLSKCNDMITAAC